MFPRIFLCRGGEVDGNMVRKEDVEPFLGKFVKLVKTDDFIVTGRILKINEDNLFLRSENATSLITLNAIKVIVNRRIDNDDE